MKRPTVRCGITAVLLLAAPLAFADSCYDPLNRNFDCNTQKPAQAEPSRAAPQKPAPDRTRLREELRRRLDDAARDDDRKREEATREETPRAPAVREAAPAAAPSEPIAAAEPAAPTNVAEVNGFVFVCDGAVDSAHVMCREIQHDGFQCIAVTADEGIIGWRDSIEVPCAANDLAQRNAFLEKRKQDADRVSLAAMSVTCQALAVDYVSAAQSGNGPAAQAAFEAIEKQGGCGLLAKVQPKAASPAADPRFISRGATPMLDQTVAACDQQREACAAVVDELRAGTSREAVAAMYSNAIAIGLEIGAAMGGAMLSAGMPRGGGVANANAGSVTRTQVRAARPRSSAPIQPPPRVIPGCRIGGPTWCTAQ